MQFFIDLRAKLNSQRSVTKSARIQETIWQHKTKQKRNKGNNKTKKNESV
jgi:hypothetical protein